MKIKRYKKVQKCIEFYTNNFGFRKPYQILVDGTFCFEALQHKINISDNIPRYLQSEIKFLTTPCVIIEMENLDRKVRGAVVILKKFAVHKCGHEKKAIPGSKCLLSMLGKANENHYIIATQDRDLENSVRLIPGVPLLYLHMKTPVLEHPSEVSVLKAKEKLSGLAEKTALDQLKQATGVVEEEINVRKKKKKRGPNPLSCKKKKTKTQQPSIRKKEGLPEKEKKKRKKLKISKHVKELIKNTKLPSPN